MHRSIRFFRGKPMLILSIPGHLVREGMHEMKALPRDFSASIDGPRTARGHCPA